MITVATDEEDEEELEEAELLEEDEEAAPLLELAEVEDEEALDSDTDALLLSLELAVVSEEESGKEKITEPELPARVMTKVSKSTKQVETVSVTENAMAQLNGLMNGFFMSGSSLLKHYTINHSVYF